MKPAAFDYLRAATQEEALEALARAGGEARILAGGQSLLPMLNMRLARPRVLVDIMRIPGLDGVAVEKGSLRIGAAARQAALLARPGLAAEQPLLAEAMPWIGHAQTRSRGTLCGSIAHADPSAELPLLLLALEGEVALRSRRRARRVAAQDFFTGLMSTAREEDEMIEAIHIPLAHPGEGHAFAEIGRRHGDFAIIACAARVREGAVRLAVGGVADRPVARAMPGLDSPELDAALEALGWELEARDDLHASAAYRRAMLRRLGRAVIARAAAEVR
ncbi:FAD binding domain-containing protein [Roseomonas sp. E05]|uniref:FAD binding domain-containing protein n=1 Tax=Roseomonas sp. E05 TaxID=3046310 RepID=UPI0024BB4DFB|nr:FAD binding domain-containing protein [Roseomonas sp. E05]MDJ0391177.1 FAD binding domain-containing protein [Roseomonas sp. E05]